MVLKTILHTPGGKMRFLKTFFRFFTIVTLCSTFTGAVFGDNFMDECSIYTNSAACTSKGCSWQDGKCTTNFAQTTNCDGYSDETACEAAKGCSWTTISGETKCFDTPAGYYNNGSGTQPCPPGDSENTYTYWETGMQSPLCRYYRTSCAEDEYFQWSTDGLSDQCKKCEAGKHIYRVDTYTHLCFNPSDNVNIGRLRKSTDYYWCSVTTELNPDGELEVNPIKKNYLGTDGDVYCLPNSYNFTLQMDTAKTFADGSTIGLFSSTYIVKNYLYDETSNELSSTNQSFTESISTVLNNHLKERFTFDSVTIKSEVDGNVKLVYNANTKKWNFGGDSNKSDALGKYQDNNTVPFILDASSAVGNSYTYYIVNQSYEGSLKDGAIALVFGSYTTGTAKYGTKTEPQLNRDNITCTAGNYLPDNITYTAYVDCKKTKTNLSCANATKTNLVPGSSNYFVPPPSDARKQGSVTNEYTYVTVLVPHEEDCPLGHFCSGTGCAQDKCTAGNYQDTKGQSSCKSCSTQTSNKYPNSAGGSDSISDCYLTLSGGQYVRVAGDGAESCPAGSYCSKYGTTVYQGSPNTPTTAAVSGTCATGKYSGEGQESCTDCGAGKKTGVNGTGAKTCTECDAGTYSDGTANALCKACDAGTHQDAKGKSSCNPCNNGHYQDEKGKATCKTCDDGNYTSNDGKSYTACIACESNQISNNDHNGCITCSKSNGQISHNNQCRVCPSGTKVNTAGDGCEACPSGTYNKNAKGSCDLCSSGFITDTEANEDPATKDIAQTIGATKKELCYLNPELKLKDTINNKEGVSLKTIYTGKIYFKGNSS